MIGIAVFLALAGVATWLGIKLGRKAAKRYPALALGLWMFAGFFRLDPSPPPRAERIFKEEEDEEAAGAPKA